jgi:hypothetical protein
MNHSEGTYVIKEEGYSLQIVYQYYWDDGDHDSPPEATLEIESVHLENGHMIEITDFYHDFLDLTMSQLLWEYAEEYKNS